MSVEMKPTLGPRLPAEDEASTRLPVGLPQVRTHPRPNEARGRDLGETA
jgi:hypothetical protein